MYSLTKSDLPILQLEKHPKTSKDLVPDVLKLKKKYEEIINSTENWTTFNFYLNLEEENKEDSSPNSVLPLEVS